jgi:hypothetical protein
VFTQVGKAADFVYKWVKGDCHKKDWAAVRREERRELPQPVVIVQNLYANLLE